MHLLDYMRDHGLDDEAFAALYNKHLPAEQHCSAFAVKKWKYRERRPDADGIIRIENITKGAVALRDWASDEPAGARA
jgi:hypothetical protein